MNKFIFTLLSFLLLNNSLAFSNPFVDARTAIVIDFHSDKVLFELEAD
jgi:D-alanyl-D-alanine carboxypeptidase